MKLLVVEEDPKLASFLLRAFEEEGDAVDACRTGTEAVAKASLHDYDLVVLDWMLPERDGLSVCRELRRLGHTVPILMLTARDGLGDKVAALDAGADDYLTKPFHLDELLARTRAVVRRSRPAYNCVLTVGPVSLDLRERAVHVGGARVALTAREFSLLALLARNAGRVVTRSEILAQVWETHRDAGSNIIDVHVRKLREKLGAAAHGLETVRGHGYRWSDAGPE